MARNYLDVATVESAKKAMADRGVSEVARGPGGFISAYKRAGSSAKLSDDWKKKREAFLDRHLAQMKGSGWETVRGESRPTRAHLALVAWGYSPTPGKLRTWLRKYNTNKLFRDRM